MSNAKTSGPKGLGKVTKIEQMRAETIVGDVRDFVLQEARDAKDGLPWTLRGEQAQREMIDRADRFARTLVERVLELVASDGQKAVPGQVKQWRVKDGLQIQIDAIEHTENIMTLCEGGRLVRIVFQDPEAYSGEREKITPAPDQRRLGLEGDEEEGGGDGPPPKPRKPSGGGDQPNAGGA